MKNKKSASRNKSDAWRELAQYVGPAIQVARVRRRLTQEELAAALGQRLRQDIRQSYVSKIENGHSCPSLERLGVICIVLGCPPDHIMKVATFLAENDGRHDEA